MPVPSMSSKNEKIIKIQREGNMSLQPSSPTSSLFPNNNSSQQQQQQESRSWSQQSSYSKRVVQSSSSPEPVVTQQSQSTSSKSSDLFSNKHGLDNSTRRDSSSSTTSNNSNVKNTNTQMKSSSLVSKALQEFEDDVQNMNQKHQESFNQTVSSSRRNSSKTMPISTPTMEIVPSAGTMMTPQWSMGTDAQGDVPLTYEIVTKADGKKEFQLLVTTKDFSPENLQVKLTDNTLTISGNQEERSSTGAYSAKSFYRTCTIPSGVRPEDLNCSLDSSGRLKITAPVPDIDPQSHSSSKMITSKHHHSSSSKQNQQNWHEDGNIPSGFKISPGEKEQVMTVFNNDFEDMNNGMGGLMGNNLNQQMENNGMSKTVKSQQTTTKTVKTFKTVA